MTHRLDAGRPDPVSPAAVTADPLSAVAEGLDPGEARLALSLLLAAPGPDPQRRAIADRLDQGLSVEVGDVLTAVARQAQLPAREAVDAVTRQLQRLGAQLRLVDRVGYPPAMATAWPELGAPAWLLVQAEAGRLPAGPAVAVVGTRSPTLSGLRTAEQLAGHLAGHGVVVVSGLARGIDTAAHRGALAARGPTVGVVGAGLAVDYPRGSARLRADVAAAGGLVGELAPGASPGKHTFLWRNRIISALSDAVVVVEGGVRSGALHTARLAASQGREVWAVPGGLDAPASAGPLALIRDGADVLTDFDDVLARVCGRSGQLQLDAGQPAGDPRWREVSPAAVRIGTLLGAQAAQPSDLARAGGVPVAEALAAVAELAAAGLAHHTPRGVIAVPGVGAPPAHGDSHDPHAD